MPSQLHDSETNGSKNYIHSDASKFLSILSNKKTEVKKEIFEKANDTLPRSKGLLFHKLQNVVAKNNLKKDDPVIAKLLKRYS